MQFEILSDMTAEHPLKAVVEGMFKAPGNPTIESILRVWLQQPGAEVEIFPTASDADNRHDGVGFAFSCGPFDAYRISLPLEVVKAQYPTIKPISDFVSPKHAPDLYANLIQIDDRGVEEMLGIDRDELYDHVVGGELFNFRDAIAYVVMYGICPAVWVTISELESDILDEDLLEGWKHANKRILAIDIMYHHEVGAKKGVVPGLGDLVYTMLE